MPPVPVDAEHPLFILYTSGTTGKPKVSHAAGAEAAVIGITDEIKGQAIAAFVTPRIAVTADDALNAELRRHVAEKIGAIARPDKLFFTSELPKTRSAKIMRRLLRDIAEGRILGDTTTLADATVMAEIKEKYEERVRNRRRPEMPTQWEKQSPGWAVRAGRRSARGSKQATLGGCSSDPLHATPLERAQSP